MCQDKSILPSSFIWNWKQQNHYKTLNRIFFSKRNKYLKCRAQCVGPGWSKLASVDVHYSVKGKCTRQRALAMCHHQKSLQNRTGKIASYPRNKTTNISAKFMSWPPKKWAGPSRMSAKTLPLLLMHILS